MLCSLDRESYFFFNLLYPYSYTSMPCNSANALCFAINQDHWVNQGKFHGVTPNHLRWQSEVITCSWPEGAIGAIDPFDWMGRSKHTRELDLCASAVNWNMLTLLQGANLSAENKASCSSSAKQFSIGGLLGSRSRHYWLKLLDVYLPSWTATVNQGSRSWTKIHLIQTQTMFKHPSSH